jgi:hypothetical protein
MATCCADEPNVAEKQNTYREVRQEAAQPVYANVSLCILLNGKVNKYARVFY